MFVTRIAAFFRSAMDFRVEACFLAAMGLTLMQQGSDAERVVIQRTTTQETAVHAPQAVRIRAIEPVVSFERSRHVEVTADGQRFRIIDPMPGRAVFVPSAMSTVKLCDGSADRTSGVASGARTCSFVRVAPVTGIARAIVVKGS